MEKITLMSHLIELLNSELEKVSIWLKANKLSLNVKKTYYMVFHRSRIKLTLMLSTPWIKFVSKELAVSNTLRVIIDRKLNWTQHCYLYYIGNYLSHTLIMGPWYGAKTVIP